MTSASTHPHVTRVAVVGAGLAGLSAALRLACAGHQVRVYEASAKVGGCCATSQLGGYTFNDGALYVALPEILDRAFERLALDRAAQLPLRKMTTPQCTVFPHGTRITLGNALAVQVDSPHGAADARVDEGADPGAMRAQLAQLLQRWRPLMDLLTGELVLQPFSA